MLGTQINSLAEIMYYTPLSFLRKYSDIFHAHTSRPGMESLLRRAITAVFVLNLIFLGLLLNSLDLFSMFKLSFQSIFQKEPNRPRLWCGCTINLGTASGGEDCAMNGYFGCILG
jgi:hypothetical protein